MQTLTQKYRLLWAIRNRWMVCWSDQFLEADGQRCNNGYVGIFGHSDSQREWEVPTSVSCLTNHASILVSDLLVLLYPFGGAPFNMMKIHHAPTPAHHSTRVPHRLVARKQMAAYCRLVREDVPSINVVSRNWQHGWLKLMLNCYCILSRINSRM